LLMSGYSASMSNLRKARKKRGWSLEVVAQKVGVTRQTVSRWETGSRRVPAERCAAIEKELGLAKEKVRPDIFT
jgi:transcriptional regulator with XRE-family HTH domain